MTSSGTTVVLWSTYRRSRHHKLLAKQEPEVAQYRPVPVTSHSIKSRLADRHLRDESDGKRQPHSARRQNSSPAIATPPRLRSQSTYSDEVASYMRQTPMQAALARTVTSPIDYSIEEEELTPQQARRGRAASTTPLESRSSTSFFHEVAPMSQSLFGNQTPFGRTTPSLGRQTPSAMEVSSILYGRQSSAGLGAADESGFLPGHSQYSPKAALVKNRARANSRQARRTSESPVVVSTFGKLKPQYASTPALNKTPQQPLGTRPLHTPSGRRSYTPGSV